MVALDATFNNKFLPSKLSTEDGVNRFLAIILAWEENA
jgi:hypothetical protein